MESAKNDALSGAMGETREDLTIELLKGLAPRWQVSGQVRLDQIVQQEHLVFAGCKPLFVAGSVHADSTGLSAFTPWARDGLRPVF